MDEEYGFDNEQFSELFVEDLKNCFVVPTLLGMWPHIDNITKQLGLGNPNPSDSERIEMYDWIVQTFNKYVFSKQDKLLAHANDIYQLDADIRDCIAKAPGAVTWVDDEDKRTTKEKGHASVKHLIYMALRDQWLKEVYDLIQAGKDMMERSEEHA